MPELPYNRVYQHRLRIYGVCLLRLLVPSLLPLIACALALNVAAPAQAKPKKRAVAQKTVKAKPKGPTAEQLKPLVLFNADGSPRSPTIEDAPTDDYQRVGWCHGILTGNMELAEQISSIEPADPRIQSIGRSYLRAYEAALTLSGKGKTPEGFALADQARQHGYAAWDGARKAEVHKAAYAYATWQLPGDCEHAATRISGHPNLFAEMATDEEAKIIAETLSSGGPRGYDELPQPKLAAQVAPEDPNAPVATNTLARRALQSSGLPSLKATTPAQPTSQPAAAGKTGSQ
jgi:hypothetical protein